ncbi:MAG TPA: glyceraldehyde 3-phosphate dehydrogenase NAD-binding domain-containing protein, partial [Bacteroidia bacterium]|nr:glyceraldehyde 3-phosphate dehydrogenase NAD-binding domain-containing protein [Bacteroidia bacterium]
MKKIRVAINGFGRIGRVCFRIMQQKSNIEVVAINDITDIPTLAHLLKYDSVHGRFKGTVVTEKDGLVVNGNKVAVFSEKDPGQLPWKALNVDLVIESTGYFLDTASAGKHIQAGAKRVIISAPAKSDVKTIVLGINDDILKKEDTILSNASCTTNCAAPMIKVLDDNWGI